MTGPHQFLRIAPTALSPEAARQRVSECLRSYGLTVSDSTTTSDLVLKLTDIAGNTQAATYASLVAGAEITGVVPELDRMLWRDGHGRGTVAAATDASEFPETVVQSGIRTSTPLQAPGFVTNDVVYELLQDVLFFRQLTAQLSFMEDQFRPCFRVYRAYLSASISAVDAWLNERAWYRLNDPAKNGDLNPSEIKRLSDRFLSIAKKLRSWPPLLFRALPLDEYSEEWVSWDRIRSARNTIIHVNDPEFNFSLRTAASSLNDCRMGVGGLLVTLHGLENTHPSPGALAIRFAPEVSFVPKAG